MLGYLPELFSERSGPLPLLRRLYLCFVLCLLSPAFTTAATEPLTPIYIASSLSQTKLSQQIELRLTAAYQALGYQLIVQRLPSGRSMLMANQGQFDGELFRIAAVAAQFPQLQAVPYPLASIQLHAYVLAEQGKDWLHWQHNSQLTVAYVRGFQLAEQYPFAGRRVAVNTVQQAVQMLVQQKVDVVLEDSSSMESLQNLEPDLQQLPAVLAEAELFHFLHQKHQALIPALQQQLSKTD